MKQTIIKINGMTSSHSISSITADLLDLDGIISVDIDLENSDAKVQFNEKVLNTSSILKTINNLGFGASI